MYSEKSHKAITKFEDELGWKNILEMNILIGKTLSFTPKEEYVVGTEGSICFSPCNIDIDYPMHQKLEAERWLKDNLERYPDGRVAKEGCTVRKLEHYPQFHQDWNELIEAIKRIQSDYPEYEVVINLNVPFATFLAVHEAVVKISTLNKVNE
jgi:hypothetical protein